MLGVVRVLNLLQKVRVAPGAAAVLGRAASGAGQAAGIMDAGFRDQLLLDPDVVFPAVTEVVEVAEARLGADEGMVEPDGTKRRGRRADEEGSVL